MNACYFETLDNIPKWKGARDNQTKQVIINTEWGALGRVRIWYKCWVLICIFVGCRMVVWTSFEQISTVNLMNRV